MASPKLLLRAALLLGGVAVAAGAPVPNAAADRVILKKGAALRGTVVRSDTDVAVNKYRSRVGAMTYGVTRVPVDQVKRIEEESDAEETVRRKRADLKPDDLAGHLGLAKFAASQKLKEAQRLLEEALTLDPKNVEALELYGGAPRFEAARKGNLDLDPELRREVGAYLAIQDGPTRAREATRLESAHAYPARAEVLERMWRSQREPKGLREDVALRLRADRSPGGAYTIYVPPTYDARTPTPLVLALHGGGSGGRDGTAVVGSGKDAATLYLQEAQRAGWILVCPTALVAPWSAGANEPYLLAVLEEVELLYHVDLDRVYLTGNATGAAGAWSFGSKHAELFAALAATAGSGGTGFKALKEARTGLFVYHSADDPVAPVAPDQQAADALLDMGADVVYLQLEDRGHSFPPEAEQEMFDVFQVKRLASAKRPSDWPRSSFARKPNPDEVKALGDPAAAWAPAAPPPKR